MQSMFSRYILLPLTLSVSLAAPSFADVQVFESSSTAQQRQQQAWSNAAKQLFQEIEILREEITRLNGQIEEQSYQIEQLKQLQLDNYVDLDKRVAALMQAQPATIGTDTIDSNSEPSPAVDDKTAYKAAYAFVQQRQFDEAKMAFQSFIKDYPQSSLQANAWFWLGGLHDLAKDYVDAEFAYDKVLTDFPDHRKAADAMYKRGEVYYKQDKKVSAKQNMLDLIKAYDGNAAYEKVVRLAREFLRKHFP